MKMLMKRVFAFVLAAWLVVAGLPGADRTASTASYTTEAAYKAYYEVLKAAVDKYGIADVSAERTGCYKDCSSEQTAAQTVAHKDVAENRASEKNGFGNSATAHENCSSEQTAAQVKTHKDVTGNRASGKNRFDNSATNRETDCAAMERIELKYIKGLISKLTG